MTTFLFSLWVVLSLSVVNCFVIFEYVYWLNYVLYRISTYSTYAVSLIIGLTFSNCNIKIYERIIFELKTWRLFLYVKIANLYFLRLRTIFFFTEKRRKGPLIRCVVRHSTWRCLKISNLTFYLIFQIHVVSSHWDTQVQYSFTHLKI